MVGKRSLTALSFDLTHNMIGKDTKAIIKHMEEAYWTNKFSHLTNEETEELILWLQNPLTAPTLQHRKRHRFQTVTRTL